MATGNMHKNMVKLGRAVAESCEWTDRHTKRHTHHNTSQPYRDEVITRSSAVAMLRVN